VDHHRAGVLLNEILRRAPSIDWASVLVSRPPAERPRFKSLDEGKAEDLTVSQKIADQNQVDGDFWQSFAPLDRQRRARGIREVGAAAAEGNGFPEAGATSLETAAVPS